MSPSPASERNQAAIDIWDKPNVASKEKAQKYIQHQIDSSALKNAEAVSTVNEIAQALLDCLPAGAGLSTVKSGFLKTSESKKFYADVLANLQQVQECMGRPDLESHFSELKGIVSGFSARKQFGDFPAPSNVPGENKEWQDTAHARIGDATVHFFHEFNSRQFLTSESAANFRKDFKTRYGVDLDEAPRQSDNTVDEPEAAGPDHEQSFLEVFKDKPELNDPNVRAVLEELDRKVSERQKNKE
jgi:polyhydroxyalkanoate synthesis regulator phasin